VRPRAGAWCWPRRGGGRRTGDYQLTPTHSFVHFEWTHAGLSTLRGRFDKVSGRVTMDRDARRGQGRIERAAGLGQHRPARAGRRAAPRAGRRHRGHGALRADTSALRRRPARGGNGPADAAARLDLPLEVLAAHFNCYLNPLLKREVCGGEFEATVEPAALGLSIDPSFGLAGPIRLRLQVEAIRQEARRRHGLACLAVTVAAARRWSAQPVRPRPSTTWTRSRPSCTSRCGTSTPRRCADAVGPVRGEVMLDADAGRGRLGLVIDMRTLDTGFKLLDARLRQADLLDVTAHPDAYFVAERFRFAQGLPVELTGEFTLRGDRWR
jgi:polyisoprenoid-binding protein YceI